MNGKNKGFITDLDDTMYATSDFLPTAIKASIKRMVECGLNVDVDDAIARLNAIREHDSNASYHLNMLLASYGMDPFNERIIMAGVTAYHNTKFALLERREHVLDVLHYLKKNGFKLGVVSSGKKGKQQEKMHRLAILDFFVNRNERGEVIDDYIFVSEENSKKWLFKEAIEKMKLDLNRTIALDDRLEGIFDAKRAGIRWTIKLNRGKYKGQTAYSILLNKGIDYRKLLNPDKKTKNLIEMYTPNYEISEWSEIVEIGLLHRL